MATNSGNASYDARNRGNRGNRGSGASGGITGNVSNGWRAARRPVVLATGALALTLGLSAPALAHVTITPQSAEPGGWTKIAFRVPNERDDASTTGVAVEFPTDHPLPLVSVRSIPGWTVRVTQGRLPRPVVDGDGDRVTRSVLKIAWTGGKIEPGQFQEFEVSAGPLPKGVDRLIFPTIQTYSNGETVAWTDPPKADGSEPGHPAPVLKLVAAGMSEAGHHPGSPSRAVPGVAPAVAAEERSHGSGGPDRVARLLGGLGVVAGLAGAVAGLAGLRRSHG